MDRDSNRLFLVARASALLLWAATPAVALAADPTSSCLTKTDCLRECDAETPAACARAMARLGRYPTPQERMEVYGKACASGHRPGCVEQAQVLSEGSADDWIKAADLLQKTCDQGEADACRKLGGLYEQGKGVPKDSLRAAALLQRACDAGASLGCTSLSEAFARGLGVAKDPAKAWKVLEDSCAAGGGAACGWMSSHLRTGTTWGPRKDEARAAALQRTACDRGYLHACEQLQKQAKEAKDTAESDRLLRQLCDQLDQPSACATLRSALKFDDAAGRVPLALRGCDLGDESACAEAARLLPQLTPPDHARAFVINDALCRNSSSPGSMACVEVALARLKGEGTKADPAGAMKTLVALCDQDAIHCETVARLHMDGTAGKRDLAKARVFYLRGCRGEPSECTGVQTVDTLERHDALASKCAARDSGACFDMGNLRATHGRFLWDRQPPVDAFRQACELGHDEGCLAQASELSRSEDQAQVKLARPMLAALCEKQVVAACVELADWQMSGHAGELQAEPGERSLRSMCQAGEDLACERLGRALLYRRDRRVTEALTLLDDACARMKGEKTCKLARSLDFERERLRQEAACEEGDGDACRRRALSGGTGPDSLPFIKRACDAGHLELCTTLLRSVTDPKRKEGPDPALAFAARHRLCLARGGAVCVEAAEQLIEGRGVSADATGARSLLANTCNESSAVGCHLLGKLHAEGLGVPKDARIALRALGRACGPAHPDACLTAGELARDAEPPVKDPALALALFRLGCEAKKEASCSAAAELAEKLMPAPRAPPARLAADTSRTESAPRPDRTPRPRYADVDDDDWMPRGRDVSYGWGAWEAGALRVAPRQGASFTPSWVGLVAYDGFGSTLDGRDRVGFGWSYRIGLLPETSRIGYDFQAGIWVPFKLSILHIVPGFLVGYDAIGAAGSADDHRVVIDGSLVNGWAIKVGLRLFSGLSLQADAARLTRSNDSTSPEIRLGGRLIITTRRRMYSFGALLYDFGDAARATGGSVQVDF